MVAYAREAAYERPGAERSIGPGRDGHLFLHHFPALRTGLLSLGPSLLRPPGYGGQAGTTPLRPPNTQQLGLKLTRVGGRRTD